MFNTNSDLLSKSGLTVEQINNLLAGHGKLEGLGQAFIDVENRDDVNAYWGMAQAILETGWGLSAIAEQKNNLFGITAYDSNPYGDASEYNSAPDCVEYWGNFIKTSYLTPGGAYYVSTTPAGIARHWATDPDYASKVVSIMNTLASRAGGGTPAPVSQPVPTAPASGTYVVQNGDNMSLVAQHEGVTLSQLESWNPHAGHPAGNFNDLWAGDVLKVNSTTGSGNGTEYYTVKPGNNLSVIAELFGISLDQIKELNPQIVNPNLIYPGESIRVK
jgi:LysM repeat protein